MAALEVRNYHGDFADVLELTRRVWTPEYGGKMWFPLPDPDFWREKVAPGTGATSLVAYEGPRLVGSIFSVPRTMRIGGAEYPVAFSSGFTVEPSSSRVALPLIERLRRANEDNGTAFGIGMTYSDPASPSFRFWTKYAQAYPRNFRFVFKGAYWLKILQSNAIARAGIKRWERMAGRTVGPLLRLTPHGFDPHVRPYQPCDLDRCSQLLEKTCSGIDWAMCWPTEQLAAQLGGPSYGTLVYERSGTVQALLNYHTFPLQGRELIRCAYIDLWAEDDMTGSARVRFISHLCRHLSSLGVDGVIAARSATMPSSALTANLFLPSAQDFWIGVFPTKRTPPLAPPRSWSFEVA